MGFVRSFVASLFLVLLLVQQVLAGDCYSLFQKLRAVHFRTVQLGEKEPFYVLSDGTEIPISRAFEKEGLFYSDIEAMYPSAKPEAAIKLRARLQAEQAGQRPKHLMRWLSGYARRYKPTHIQQGYNEWARLAPEAQLDRILAEADFFRRINRAGKNDLFYDEILTYDDLAVTRNISPDELSVTDDLGSYEIRSAGGEADRAQYFLVRKSLEKELDGKVGHQHIVHAWPESVAARTAMAPRYIELLDSVTWFLFWRQMKRDPAEVSSVLTHPYLGVYSRDMLDQLHGAVLDGMPSTVKDSGFNNKYRMVGARSMPGDPRIPGQQGKILPDFELRSGNKGMFRGLIEDLMEARIGSGDYRGLKDYRSYQFDASATIERIAGPFLEGDELAVLRRFEESFRLMKYSDSPLAHNHYRNRIIAPLLPWQKRLELGTKAAQLATEQRIYAKRLVEIARDYLNKIEKTANTREVSVVYSSTTDLLEDAIFAFSREVRLDRDFVRYLIPKPDRLPMILVQSTGPIDVNQIGLGIEYTFRFPMRAQGEEAARAEIKATLDDFKEIMGGGTVEEIARGGHGHGVSIRYKFKDPTGLDWRFEWDGISRDYIDGQVANPRGGLLEVPSPKFAPQNLDVVRNLYEAARKSGKRPVRTSGGSHVNVDLGPLFKMGDRQGPRRLANLISYFESNREIISFLWQHARRMRVALPSESGPSLYAKLDSFDGDWNALARILYDERYFNTRVGRKPRYVQMDVTGAIMPAVPDEYFKRDIDIKNPAVQWLPDFGGGKDRIEFRLFDAMEDEFFAALQIKYIRALVNRTLNHEGVLRYSRAGGDFAELWKQDPKKFVEAAEAHLKDLGLDPQEFQPLLIQSWEKRVFDSVPVRPADEKFESFLPSKLENASLDVIAPEYWDLGGLFEREQTAHAFLHGLQGFLAGGDRHWSMGWASSSFGSLDAASCFGRGIA